MLLGPIVFSFFTLMHLSIAIVALLLLKEFPLAALCLFVVEAVTAFDNFVTVAGNSIGINKSAERLNRSRFFLHAVCISLLLPVYFELGRNFAGNLFGAAAESGTWMLVLVIALLGYFYQYRRTGEILPINYFGCLRYAQSVTEATRYPGYEYSAGQISARGHPPIASVITVLTGLIMSLLTGWIGSFWIPFIVTLIMFLAAGFPRRDYGPLVTSCLEVIFSGGILYSLWFAADIMGS